MSCERKHSGRNITGVGSYDNINELDPAVSIDSDSVRG
jgi:hypothetical protein